MNKRDREQLKASIAKDLLEGQGEHSATKELLRQYAPLEGIVSTPPGRMAPRPGRETPVENSMAPHARVAGSANAAEDATLAQDATVAPEARVAPHATNKDDDDFKNKSSSKGHKRFVAANNSENHSRAAAPREKEKTGGRDLALVRAAYEKATSNRWNKSDTEAYEENNLGRVPAAQTISVLEAVTRRTPAKINSLKYFVKEILAMPDPRNRAWKKSSSSASGAESVTPQSAAPIIPPATFSKM